MKVKTKLSSTVNTKLSTTPKNSLLSSNKPKGLIQDSNPSMAVKATRKKITPSGKQNMQTLNVPSLQNNIRNKNYKPRLKKQPKLGLSNTISLIINQSQHSAKKNDLLDSLLYGQFDLSYSQDLRSKEEENDQLLIETCEQKEQKITFKYCSKHLSPIKSISQYSVNQNQNQNQLFIVQKVDSKIANAILKIKRINLTQSQPKSKLNCVLYRRILVLFKQKQECLIKFYTTIHQAINKQDLQSKIRQFLFQNAIIFNKAQLNQFIQQIYITISDINTDSKHEFCQQNIEILMQRLFLYVPKNNNSSQFQQNIWIRQDIFDKLFYDKNMLSIWKLVKQLCVQAHKQIQTSFRQSRFCLSMDTSIFIHQTDQKRKNQTVYQIQKYLIKYLMPSQFDVKSTIDMLQNKKVHNEQIKITVIPPPLRSNIN